MISGGAGSWATSKRVVACHGVTNTILLFADTLMEDEDLYRFLIDGVQNTLGISLGQDVVDDSRIERIPPIGTSERRDYITDLAHRASRTPYFKWIVDGRDPWGVFREGRYIGNSRVDPCSLQLKRQLMRRWIERNVDETTATCYIGIDWSEEHRFTKSKKYWKPWTIRAPMCDPPYLSKEQVLDWMRSEDIRPPRLYDMGFAHNNCGGFCIKAGQGHFKQLLEKMPERFAYHEAREQDMRSMLGKDVTILRQSRNGQTYNLSLKDLRHQVEHGETIDTYDIGGCGCLTPEEGSE